MKADNRPRLNRDWHLAHKMPPRPTLEERLAWHEEHAKHCACREMPAWMREEIERRRVARESRVP
jgi:hypothetical protein